MLQNLKIQYLCIISQNMLKFFNIINRLFVNPDISTNLENSTQFWRITHVQVSQMIRYNR